METRIVRFLHVSTTHNDCIYHLFSNPKPRIARVQDRVDYVPTRTQFTCTGAALNTFERLHVNDIFYFHSPPRAYDVRMQSPYLPIVPGEYEGVGHARVQRGAEREGVVPDVASLIASPGTVGATRAVAVRSHAKLEFVVTAGVAGKVTTPIEHVSIAAVAVRVVASSRPGNRLHP